MSHRHYPGGQAEDTACVEVGPTVCLRPFFHGGDPDVTDATTGEVSGGPVEHLAGFIFGHDRAGFDIRCEGAVTVDTDREARARWSMSGSLEGGDLTLDPSILCRLGSADPSQECGFHGWIRDGKWVPA